MIIGVCGYGFTGASAVVDVLKEYDDILFSSSGRVFEFSLPYTTDGLLDLEYHLTTAPAKHLKGDTAIQRFLSYTTNISEAMNRETNGQFKNLTKEYVDSLVQVRYPARRTGEYHHSKLVAFVQKALLIIQLRMEDKLHRHIPLLKEYERYICVHPDAFVEKTCNYIENILCAGGLLRDGKITLLDQPFPPNNPEQVFHFFEDPYAIVVDRDPRDIYLTVKRLRFTTGRFIPHDDVKDFVNYYRVVRKKQTKEYSKRILRINFEDLIYNYDDTVHTLEKFLSMSAHTRKGVFFKPELSIRSTQLKAVFPDEIENIEYIERELPEYLYPFEQYEAVDNRESIFEIAKL